MISAVLIVPLASRGRAQSRELLLQGQRHAVTSCISSRRAVISASLPLEAGCIASSWLSSRSCCIKKSVRRTSTGEEAREEVMEKQMKETPQVLRLSSHLPLLVPFHLAQLSLSRGQLPAELLQLASPLADHEGEPVLVFGAQSVEHFLDLCLVLVGLAAAVRQQLLEQLFFQRQPSFQILDHLSGPGLDSGHEGGRLGRLLQLQLFAPHQGVQTLVVTITGAATQRDAAESLQVPLLLPEGELQPPHLALALLNAAELVIDGALQMAEGEKNDTAAILGSVHGEIHHRALEPCDAPVLLLHRGVSLHLGVLQSCFFSLQLGASFLERRAQVLRHRRETPLAGLQLQTEGEQGALHRHQLGLQLGEHHVLADPLWHLKNHQVNVREAVSPYP
ncbi:hypothetical protein EYF80_021984 [Liparis tanakae]|uniref:Uncharacterized protein n=1 Tax=Liparis tanakae TaxID=230148 RepID=A0A4Z2HQC4_9TELE|nr:hypothetical protein EYF80_021984 [Liparis tanakae]